MKFRTADIPNYCYVVIILLAGRQAGGRVEWRRGYDEGV